MNSALSNTPFLPATIILGAVRLLKNIALTAQQRDYLNDIIHVAEQMVNSSKLTQRDMNKQKRVLVVEDILLIQGFHKEYLLELGYYVDVADNMSQALAKVENNYDLLILDIGLPDGIEIDVAKTFRAHPKHQNTFIIALTFSSDEMKTACFAACMNEFYTKPVSPKKLAEIIKNTFEIELTC